MLPDFVAQLPCLVLGHLVHERPETRSVVHLDGVAEFVQEDVVNEMRREEKQVEREIDIAMRIAAAPSRFGRLNFHVGELKTPARSER